MLEAEGIAVVAGGRAGEGLPQGQPPFSDAPADLLVQFDPLRCAAVPGEDPVQGVLGRVGVGVVGEVEGLALPGKVLEMAFLHGAPDPLLNHVGYVGLRPAGERKIQRETKKTG